jgi:hypothetical protein
MHQSCGAGAEEPKLNSFPGPKNKLRIALRFLSIYHRLGDIL